MMLVRCFFLPLLLLLSACTPDPPDQRLDSIDPGQSYVLTPEQLEQAVKEAEAGSSDAMWRLVQHYSLGIHDDERRRFWTAQLAAANPENWISQLNYARDLIELGRAENCTKAEEILKKLAQSTDERARRRSKAAMEGMKTSGRCPSSIQ